MNIADFMNETCVCMCGGKSIFILYVEGLLYKGLGQSILPLTTICVLQKAMPEPYLK